MKKLLLAAVLLAILTGCKQVEYVPVIEHRTDTVIQTKWQHDSIRVRDSIFVSDKGDTVRIEKWHTEYVEKLKIDTIYQSKTDSVPVPVHITQVVEAPLSWWQRTQMYAGDVLLIGLLILIGYGAFRLWKVYKFF